MDTRKTQEKQRNTLTQKKDTNWILNTNYNTYKYILKDDTSWLECKQRMEVCFNNSIVHHFNRLEFYDHPMKCRNVFDKFYLLFTAKRKNS